MVSPFEVEEREISSLVIEPPKFFTAHSKLLSVRVEFSKNMVMILVCARLCAGLLLESKVVESNIGRNCVALCKMRSISSVDRSLVSIRWRIGFLGIW